MNEQTIVFLKELSERLGTTSEYLFGILVRQAPISGWLHLIMLGVFVTITFFTVRFANRAYVLDKNEALIICSWFTGGVLLIFDICLLTDMGKAISAIINPEYWALSKIIDR